MFFIIILSDSYNLALPFNPSHLFIFFLQQKEQQIAVLIHSCSHSHYTNFELCSKKSQKIEKQGKKKVNFVDWITKKGDLESMNFAWAIMGAVVYKI